MNPQPQASNLQHSVGIVGAGLLGMTLALRLADSGCDVTLIEAGKKPGGLAIPGKIGEYTWDRFYHVILLSDRNYLDLLHQLKLTDQVKWNSTKTGFFSNGRLHSLSNFMEFLTFPPLNLVERLRLGFGIFYASRVRDWERLEKYSVESWLSRISGEKTFQKIWLPLLRCKLGNNCHLTNASFIWATIARMYAARRNGLKQEKFGYVDGGYAKILEYFQQELASKGVKIILNGSVKEIAVRQSGVEVNTGGGGNSLHFKNVILTIPSKQIASLCPGFTAMEKSKLKEIPYQGIICAALLLKKPLAGYYITNITDDHSPFTGVIEMTALVDRKNFDGLSLVYLPLYLPDDDPIWGKGDEEIANSFFSGLRGIYPHVEKGDLSAAAVFRARDVFPIPTLNYSKTLLPSTRTSLKDIYIVNSSQIPNGTMNVNEIVGLADRKAKELIGLFG